MISSMIGQVNEAHRGSGRGVFFSSNICGSSRMGGRGERPKQEQGKQEEDCCCCCWTATFFLAMVLSPLLTAGLCMSGSIHPVAPHTFNAAAAAAAAALLSWCQQAGSWRTVVARFEERRGSVCHM